jgi:ABC-type multidrug transport system fused ATPase/permease subunit
LGALSVTGLQSGAPGDRVSSALRFLQISNLSFQIQATIIGLGAVLLLVGRTLLSIIFTRKILLFFSRRGAKISADLTARLLSQQLSFIQTRTMQEILFATTSGVTIVTLQILATAVVLASDISLLVIMSIGLFVLDPSTALGLFLIFSFIGYLLHRILNVRASELGIQNSILGIRSNERIVEVFSSYRESVVRNRRDFYARDIGRMRLELADNAAEISFMPYISKYVIETAVILGALLVGFVQFVFQDTAHAVATLAIFLAAGSRIAPAVLRIQQSLLTIRGSLGQAQPTLKLLEELGDKSITINIDDAINTVHTGFDPTIKIESISLTYPGGTKPAISGVSLDLPRGASVAIVGPSGGGKTTLIDIILGVLAPDSGTVLVSGLPPLMAAARWPGAISYVPQDVSITSGTVRENVGMGYPLSAVTDKLVMNALALSHLNEFVENLPKGLETQVGERGAKLSGGQRQRLGIARALFTQPQLLVLDEATSSLDGETETNISEAINQMRGSTTIVMIAHRLSTVRSADLVVYLAEGKIVAIGTFEEVRRIVPDFNRQASLMGL